MDSLKLPLSLGLLGFLASTRTWIKTMDKLNPFEGLIVYYSIITFTILILQSCGLVVSGIKFDTSAQTIGTILIVFSFFIIIDWTSCYVNFVVNGQCDQKKISNIYLQSEDGTTFYLWSKLTKNIEYLRILTYVVTPMVLTFIGQRLITGKVTLGLL